METFNFCHSDAEGNYAEKSFSTQEGDECVPLRTVVEKFKEFLTTCGYYQPLIDSVVVLDA